MSCRSAGRGVVIVQGCEPATFSISPYASKPLCLDDLTSWTKVPFAFHFLYDKRREKSIVHCNALSPFWHQQNWGTGERSIQIKSKYKRGNEKEAIHVWKSICFVWVLKKKNIIYCLLKWCEQMRRRERENLKKGYSLIFFTIIGF